MLSTAVVALIAFGLGFALMDLFEADPDTEDNAEDDVLLVNMGDTFEGTDDDDIITLAYNGEDTNFDQTSVLAETTTIDGGAGDDTIDLTVTDTGLDVTLERLSEINGGDGDDTITVRAVGSITSGDAGDDTIDIIDGFGGTVEGGDGNDTITVGNLNTNPIAIYGGDGDDFIDATNVNNGSVQGDGGDDLILLSYGNQGGNGYVVEAFGDEGDDTIRFDGSLTLDGTMEPMTAYGGEGDDTFELSLFEGRDGTASEDDRSSVDLIILGDFDPNEDDVVIEATVNDPDFTLASGRLDEDTDAGITKLIFTYEDSNGDDREVNVVLNAVGVDWDDVSFADGTQPPLLVPVAAS